MVNGRLGGVDVAAAGEGFFGNGEDDVVVRVGGVDDGQFVAAIVLGVVARAADFEAHLAFDLDEVGDELAAEEEEQAGVDEGEADFGALEFKAFDVRGEEVTRRTGPMSQPPGKTGMRRWLPGGVQ